MSREVWAIALADLETAGSRTEENYLERFMHYYNDDELAVAAIARRRAADR
jgi:hypothetical protein